MSGQRQTETDNLNRLQEDLEKQMKCKRFLIVLDDVWDDMNQSSWDKLLAPLKCNQAMGNMIIVTTRKLSIADMTKTIDPVLLNALERDDFWRLFKSCAFGNEEYEEDQGLCVIGKQIAKDLGGNPLAAKTVGALLKRNINVGNWSNILYNMEWKSLQVDGIMPALKISYDYLPEHLQQCFRYCCLFPKDYHFDEVKLIRIWISQGFVHGSHTGKKQEDAGKDYLAYLVNSGFFQHVSYSSDTFVMHDLLHDLACQVSKTDFATIDGSERAKISPTTRHLSIVIDSAHRGASENFERKLLQITSVRRLRSLLLIGAYYYDPHFFKCFNNIFKEAHNLRFLQIEAITYSDFDSVISNLGRCPRVRYVEVELFDILEATLSQCIVNFFHLQVLDVGLDTNLTFPHGMSNLVSIQHLVAHEEAQSSIANVGKMTALRELPMFKVGVQNDSGFDLKQLQSMNQLVHLGIYQLENVQSKREASEARLIDKVYLEDVLLSWDDASRTTSRVSTDTSTNVLEGLRPYRSLKHLKIIGYNGSSNPSWLVTDISITSLQSLHLEKCSKLGALPPLLRLPFLRKLKLIDMPGIVEVEIPCLEKLKLVELPRLENCVATSNSELNCHLQSLIIKNCPELKEFAPFTSENFCSFEVIQNSGMSKLERKSAEHSSAVGNKWLPVLRVLMIHGCPRLKLIHALPPSSNTQLSIKGLPTCPAIERCSGNLLVKSSNDLEILDAKILAFQNLKDVTSVQIQNCPNLVFLSFEGFRQLNNLREMTITKCGNLVSLLPNAGSETWRATTCPAFPHLKHLKIESCGGIAGKWLTEMLLHMQSLEELDVVECPEIKSLSIQKAESHNMASSSECEAVLPTILAQHEFHLYISLNVLSTLQKIHIQYCPEMQLCGSEGFGGFTLLTMLEITACPMLFSSADERFSLPALVEALRIRDLPKRLQLYFPAGRTFLKELEVGDSPDLQFLCLYSCTALERLDISGCCEVAVLEGLEHMNSLRYLSIEMNPKLSGTWVRKCEELEESSSHVCLLPPSVEDLRITDLQEEVVPYLLAHLPCLSKLHVSWGQNLTSLQLGSIAALQKLSIQYCASLASIQGCLSELEECWFGYLDLTSVQPGLFPALKHLQLHNCTELASLGRHFFGDLIDLEIHSCGSIAALLEVLSRQHAEGCSILPRLERLSVDDLSVLDTSLCKHLTSLRDLKLLILQGVTCFTDEQEMALQLLTSLQKLIFFVCRDLAHLPAILRSLHSLKKLEISYCDQISRLPEKGLPPSLEQLTIQGSSMQLEDQCRMLPTEKLKVTII
ncbi:unnamed protein product [Urochloa humidicola]